jgi:diaminopimelate decarboxylase
MLAKPTAEIEPIADRFWRSFRERLNAMHAEHGSLQWQGGIFEVVADAAAELLVAGGAGGVTKADVWHWFRQWSRCRMDGGRARRAMTQSYAVAMGIRPKDIPFALGEAWRKLYPELVALVSYGGLIESDWSAFERTSREMERIAFGPPAASVGKLLSLMKFRRLKITSVDEVLPKIGQTIDAVIAGPHDHRPNGVIVELERSGCLRRDAVTDAVMVDRDGYAVGVTGLAIFGRATEGWVLGNDTLTRTMHPQMERWGQRVRNKIEQNSFPSKSGT